MSRNILFTSNDVITRELVAKFFHSHGYVCECANCDEKLLAHLNTVRPKILISEVSLRSRFFSPHDNEAAFSLLLAARCRIPELPVFVINKVPSTTLAERTRALGITDYFEYPLDLSQLLNRVRAELRRVSRLKNHGTDFYPQTVKKNGRGRPRKYPEVAPVNAGKVEIAA